MQYVYKMERFDLGPFNLLEAKVGTQEGMRSCHDYGRTFGENWRPEAAGDRDLPDPFALGAALGVS